MTRTAGILLSAAMILAASGAALALPRTDASAAERPAPTPPVPRPTANFLLLLNELAAKELAAQSRPEPGAANPLLRPRPRPIRDYVPRPAAKTAD